MFIRARRVILNILSALISLMICATVVFLTVLLAVNIVYTRTRVVGPSMQPTLNAVIDNSDIDRDYIYINQYCARNVGDIVVARRSDKYIVKRLIGLQGDMIQIKPVDDEYQLIVNDEILYTKPMTDYSYGGAYGGTNEYYNMYLAYLYTHIDTDSVTYNDDGEMCIIVGRNQCFLMGDNWGQSTDSITYGAMNVNNIVGVVDIVVHYDEPRLTTFFKQLWQILT